MNERMTKEAPTTNDGIFALRASSFTITFLQIANTRFTIADVKPFSSYRPWLVTILIACCFLPGCGGASHQIVGSWRIGDDSTAMVWEFSNDGSVLMGTNRGRYSFGDNNRIKIETSMATSVYQMELVGDKMTLKDPNGSKLVLTKVKQ
jgi:hypothetical protein